MSGAPLLEVSELRTTFSVDGEEARAVDGVSFRIGAGEAVGLVGESGCGKTATLLSILALLPPSARVEAGSSVRIRGEEMVGASGAKLRTVRGGVVGAVFQNPTAALNPVMRVGDQVAEAVRAHGSRRGRAARGRAAELLDEVGLPEAHRTARAYPHELSGGQRQRVSLAIALAGEPVLLLADEPTTALDVTVQAQILELLERLRSERELALLLVSHDLAVVGATCERALVMYAGEIVERGPVARVLSDPLHPYTEGLIAALPRAGRTGRSARLVPVPGRVPDPTAWPPACRFEPRCGYAWARCRSKHPSLLEQEPDERAARCWLLDEPGRRERGEEAIDG